MSYIDNDRADMLARLGLIDEQGWNSPTAVELLNLVRDSLVVPEVSRIGLTGAAAAQAEATAWEEAWEALCRPSIREVSNPWGLLRIVVRRAALTEAEGARIGSAGRAVWRAHEKRPDTGRVASPEPLLSLDQLLESDFEPAGLGATPAPEAGSVIPAICRELVRWGWDSRQAWELLVALCDLSGGNGRAGVGSHWRKVAMETGVPQWRVRRIAALLTGGPGWPGLVEAIVREGEAVLAEPIVAWALRATLDRRAPSTQSRLALRSTARAVVLAETA